MTAIRRRFAVKTKARAAIESTRSDEVLDTWGAIIGRKKNPKKPKPKASVGPARSGGPLVGRDERVVDEAVEWLVRRRIIGPVNDDVNFSFRAKRSLHGAGTLLSPEAIMLEIGVLLVAPSVAYSMGASVVWVPLGVMAEIAIVVVTLVLLGRTVEREVQWIRSLPFEVEGYDRLLDDSLSGAMTAKVTLTVEPPATSEIHRLLDDDGWYAMDVRDRQITLERARPTEDVATNDGGAKVSPRAMHMCLRHLIDDALLPFHERWPIATVHL